MTSFEELLVAHLVTTGVPITGGGVRYGSVMYLGFGDTWTENLLGQWETRRFAVELELGADDWCCLLHGHAYLSTDCPNPSLERDVIDKMFVGRRVLSVSFDDEHFNLSVSGGVIIRSAIKVDQASGFLLTLTLPRESYETLDGQTFVT